LEFFAVLKNFFVFTPPFPPEAWRGNTEINHDRNNVSEPRLNLSKQFLFKKSVATSMETHGTSVPTMPLVVARMKAIAFYYKDHVKTIRILGEIAISALKEVANSYYCSDVDSSVSETVVMLRMGRHVPFQL
jgi:hypothetical protein